MFGFVRKWRQARRMKQMIAAGAVFGFWDGRQIRYADPFRIWRELTQDEQVNLERLLPEMDDMQCPAIETALAHTCKVFGVARWNETTQTGLTDLEILNLLRDVMEWTAYIKKNSSPGRTSPPSTPAPTSSASPAPPSATSNVCSACTSTASDRPPAEPGQSTAPSATDSPAA